MLLGLSVQKPAGISITRRHTCMSVCVCMYVYVCMDACCMHTPESKASTKRSSTWANYQTRACVRMCSCMHVSRNACRQVFRHSLFGLMHACEQTQS